MLRTMSVRRLFIAALPLCLVGGFVGCSSDPAYEVPLTESDAARLEAENLREKQAMLERGEQLVRDGEAERARGEAMVNQGNTVEGQPMVAAGEAKVAQGRALIDRANEMETEVEPIEVDVPR